MLSRKYTIAICIAAAISLTGSVPSVRAFSTINSSRITQNAQSTHVSVTTTGDGEVTIDTKENTSATITPTPTKTPTPTPTTVKIQTTATSPTTTLSIEDLLKRLNITMPTLSPSKTITPTPTNTPTPTPTKTVTPTPTKTPTPTPTSTQNTNSLLDDKQQYMMNAINAYRKQNGLYAVQPDKYTCDFATTRAKEISLPNNFNHVGFETRVNSHTIPYPGYSSITENIAMTSNYQNVVNMWINSSGHAANMRKDTPYVCVAYSGNFFAYEGRRP